jgi:hypothetical protein
MSNKQIFDWLKKNVSKDRVRAGVPTFTALQVLNILIGFNDFLNRKK